MIRPSIIEETTNTTKIVEVKEGIDFMIDGYDDNDVIQEEKEWSPATNSQRGNGDQKDIND